jgi:hypothetical protein
MGCAHSDQEHGEGRFSKEETKHAKAAAAKDVKESDLMSAAQDPSAFFKHITEKSGGKLPKKEFIEWGNGVAAFFIKESPEVQRTQRDMMHGLPPAARRSDEQMLKMREDFAKRMLTGLTPVMDKLFDAFDVDHSGELDESEVQPIVDLLTGTVRGEPLSPELSLQLFDIFSHLFDTNQNGQLDSGEVFAVADTYGNVAAILGHTVIDMSKDTFLSQLKDELSGKSDDTLTPELANGMAGGMLAMAPTVLPDVDLKEDISKIAAAALASSPMAAHMPDEVKAAATDALGKFVEVCDAIVAAKPGETCSKAQFVNVYKAVEPKIAEALHTVAQAGAHASRQMIPPALAMFADLIPDEAETTQIQDKYTALLLHDTKQMSQALFNVFLFNETGKGKPIQWAKVEAALNLFRNTGEDLSKKVETAITQIIGAELKISDVAMNFAHGGVHFAHAFIAATIGFILDIVEPVAKVVLHHLTGKDYVDIYSALEFWVKAMGAPDQVLGPIHAKVKEDMSAHLLEATFGADRAKSEEHMLGNIMKVAPEVKKAIVDACK